MYRLQAEIGDFIGEPGAGESLEQMLKTQRPRIEGMLKKHLGARQDLDDLVQTVYLELLRALPKFRGESTMSTFICGVTLMVARRARRGTVWDARRLPLEFEAEDRRASPEQRVIAREQLEKLESALDRIAVQKREAFLEWSVEGRTPQEIAERSNTSLAATRSRIFYARKELDRRARKDDALRELVSTAR